ncbi:VOC family protein [Planctobacterium marinum]|uniref:VOC family protein n=1 Tax=Planctobacterium marinum TaxID=1631968 RepID=UPI001E479E6F|nr:VOC family protein [Planctobacterium marinum]MCC2606340.1 VOC family protein [Planctobacterium marinum]
MTGPGKMTPMLNVKDIFRSLDFYQDALGFELLSPMEELIHFRWGIIAADGTEFMLSESESAPQADAAIDPLLNHNWAVNFYFYPANIKALHDALLKKKFQPTALKQTEYGMQEFSIQDPDGHLLSFGAESRT